MNRSLSILVQVMSLSMGISAGADDFLTVAEQSGHTRTASYAEVIDLMDRITDASDIVRRAEMGTTHEGRSIPLAIIANPPVATPQEARESGKLIVLAFGNIHAGEVCGKEALLQLMREFALQPEHDLLDDLIIILAPIYNADGNDMFGPVARNRPGQVGPEEVGQRRNALDLDLNRDYVKLDTPEARALVGFLTEWDPHLTIDTHTTNGSYHRYTITYAAPQNPSGATEPIEFVRDQLLPEVTDRLRERTGYETFFYGNFNRDQTVWATYSHEPRFGCPYRGLRGQMSILSEAYSYAPFKDRVECTREFVREIMQYAAEHREEMISIHQRAKEQTIVRGRDPQPSDTVGIRYRLAAFPEPATIKGWKMESPQGDNPRRGVRPQPTDEPQDYPVVHLGRYEAALGVARPHAYLIEAGNDAIIEKLRQHGVQVEPFSGVRVRCETYEITHVQESSRPFEGRTIRSLDVRSKLEERDDFGGDSWIVPTAQPLGNLIVYLLEPQSDDGLAAWGLFGDQLAAGSRYPVARVRYPTDFLK